MQSSRGEVLDQPAKSCFKFNKLSLYSFKSIFFDTFYELEAMDQSIRVRGLLHRSPDWGKTVGAYFCDFFVLFPKLFIIAQEFLS